MAYMHMAMVKVDHTVVANSSAALVSGWSLWVMMSMLMCVFVYWA